MQPDAETESMVKTRTISATTAKELSASIRSEVAVEVATGLELDLWASDSLIHDPIAISIDQKGRIFYTSASRQENSEFDIRGHRNWMTASISFETPEDRSNFLKETFTADSEESTKFLKDLNNDGTLDWRDLTVEKEEVWWVADEDGDGSAEKAQLFVKDFHEEITDVANGLLVHEDEVYLAAAPDLWRITDKDGDGVADESKSISRGYAVHIGFSGHGMSGVTIGPNGRIWWGIGDIGMNVKDKSGKQWEYPHQGVIVRSDPDGSNFEVYSAGHRNTHEFVFDKYGNLITEDNDGDHRGERERLVYVINGSDSGWRANWQYGKYTDPNNNGYKVWMDEKMSVPRWEGQAAYIIPPIQNYVNGPTGMVYNPGTALSEEWYDHFFIAEFRGNPANSPVHAFTMEPEGAGFKLGKTQKVVSGLLPTGLDFGPDGALYFGDWIDGWGTKDKGRIWKIDVPGGANSAIRQETKKHISSAFSTYELSVLSTLLAHQDMRVRLKAQFELVKRGNDGKDLFVKNLDTSLPQMQRIHSVWGIAQLARNGAADGSLLLGLLDDADLEVKAQAIKMLGDIRYAKAGNKIISDLKNNSQRIQMLSAEALGRMQYPGAKQGLIDLLVENDDKDVFIRHAASYALSRIGDAEVLIAQKDSPSKAARIGAVVALRRMEHEGVSSFLDDENELVVTEAARAINDDNSIVNAIPALAEILNTTKFQNEALIRRSINANFRLGEKENINQLLTFISNPNATDAMKAEAIACIGTWGTPSVLDRVDGRNRGLSPRDNEDAVLILSGNMADLSKSGSSEILVAITKAAKQLNIVAQIPLIEELFYSTKDLEVKKEALIALNGLKSEKLDQLLESALSDDDEDLRATALGLIPESSLDESTAMALFDKILSMGTVIEKQSAYAAISSYRGEEAKDLLSKNLSALIEGNIAPEVRLDLLEASAVNGDEGVLALVNEYQGKKDKADALAEYAECLSGGNPRNGRNIFYRNEAAQCVRCHSIFEWGGDAGPGLQGIGGKLSPTEILEALVNPSAKLAEGFGIMSAEMKDGSSVAGVMEKETESTYTLRISEEESKTISKSEIKESAFLPSSMPPVDKILDKKQLRDVVAFLTSLMPQEEG